MCVSLQVVFEVAFNSPSGGRVAVDDISFSPQFCSTDSGELQPHRQSGRENIPDLTSLGFKK